MQALQITNSKSELARKAALIGAEKRKLQKLNGTHSKPKKSEELTYRILSDIPCPSSGRTRNIKFIAALEKMEVGQCILFKDRDAYKKHYGAAGNFGKKSNKTFAGRPTETGFGIWRVK